MQGYCVKCKEKRDMNGATPVTFKNGKSGLKGTCPICSTKMVRFTK
jgi:hypothetical protein